MEKIVQTSAGENKKKNEEYSEVMTPARSIDMVVDGEVIGNAQLYYFSKPFPLYEIGSIVVNEEKRGEGYGSKIMAYLETMLKEKGRAGVLIDGTDPSSPVSGMYARRGWEKVPNSPWWSYNIPKSGSIEQLESLSDRMENDVRMERLYDSYDKEKAAKNKTE